MLTALDDTPRSLRECGLGLLALHVRRWECGLKLCSARVYESFEMAAMRVWTAVLDAANSFVLASSTWPILRLLLRIQELAPPWTRTHYRFSGGGTPNCTAAGSVVGEPPHCNMFRKAVAGADEAVDGIGLNPAQALGTAKEGKAHGLGLNSPRLGSAFTFLADMLEVVQEQVQRVRVGGGLSLLGQTALHSVLLLHHVVMRYIVEVHQFEEFMALMEFQERKLHRLLRDPGVVASLALCLQCWPVFHILVLIGSLAFRAYGVLPLVRWALAGGPVSQGGVLPSPPRDPCGPSDFDAWGAPWSQLKRHACRFCASRGTTATAMVAVAYGTLQDWWLSGFVRRTHRATRGAAPLILVCDGATLCAACDGEMVGREEWLLCLSPPGPGEGPRGGDAGPRATSEELKIALGFGTVLALVTLGIDALYLDLDVYLFRDPSAPLSSLVHGRGVVGSNDARVFVAGTPLEADDMAPCTRGGEVVVHTTPSTQLC